MGINARPVHDSCDRNTITADLSDQIFDDVGRANNVYRAGTRILSDLSSRNRRRRNCAVAATRPKNYSHQKTSQTKVCREYHGTLLQ